MPAKVKATGKGGELFSAGVYDTSAGKVVGDCHVHPKDLKNGELSILQIIGTNDSYFLQVNRKFHKQLVKDEIEHVYVEIRGEDKDHSAHNGIFRQMAMPVMLNYLNNFFREGKGRL